MKIVAIVQARMGSTRLPNKVMKHIVGVPMIELLLRRLEKSKMIDEIIVATSVSEINDPLVKHVEKLRYACVRGSEDNVLERYFKAASLARADVILRITGDCPLIDPVIIDVMIQEFGKAEVDYLSNVAPPTYPDGLDVEIFTFDALRRAYSEACNPVDLEHVTPYLRNSGLFKIKNYSNNHDLSRLRWTVDYDSDFEVIKNVFEAFAPEITFSWTAVLDLYYSKPEIFKKNNYINRNDKTELNSGQKLWKRAKSVIPGGNMLLSKRPEMFLPGKWPSYFSKASGCKVWDLEGREYIDMSIMGIGTNTLGYGHPEVDAVVLNAIQSGNMSTLNCPEEVYLAEKLVELHPWADMVKFARTGGEANAIAIRIARAAAGKDKVAICGYHGWHDWYLAANLGEDDSLDGHLLPGLQPNGVPRSLKGTVFPFRYNHLDELDALIDSEDIGVIKMEVSRNMGPENDFLIEVRRLASRKNIVLIFDECTSGFRETFGGLHKKYGVDPDMAIFGKALGNGYAVTATIGRREIMEAAQATFISSTFWSERIGPSAALKTLEVMEREVSWKRITEIGLTIRRRWQILADKHELKLDHWGLPALAGFTIKSSNSLAYKTLITQEMLKKGYFAGTSVYVCTEHTEKILDGFFGELDEVFRLIRECEEGRSVLDLLESPICHSGFKRLN